MQRLTRRDVLALLLAAPAAEYAWPDAGSDWVPLFDGKSLDGWKANGNATAFSVADGQIVAQGAISHLFYTGPVRNADFKNFELTVDVKNRPASDSGVYFHTVWQPEGWPQTGFEVQIANAVPGENRKTGSLYDVRNVYKQLVPENEWFTMRIAVRGRQVQVRLNAMLVVDYVEPDPPFTTGKGFQRVLHHGTFALQGHGPGHTTYFKNIRVRPLPDDLPLPSSEPPQVDELYRETMRLVAQNYPVVDYHVHLKGGLTLDQVLANSRRLGIFYGIAINCGLGFPVHDDASVQEYLRSMQGQACYAALQGEGREWTTLVSPESIARFDYCFTDAMTFRDDNGRRVRLWIPEETPPIPDAQAFMEMYVNRIEGVMREPIDIYANPTYLPDPIAAHYDELWTPARMKRVIDAAIENDVAIEINNRRQIPSPAFIKAAKAAGAKFSFGTNNAESELGRLEYPIRMVRECGLRWQDIFVPKPDGQKPVRVKRTGMRGQGSAPSS